VLAGTAKTHEIHDSMSTCIDVIQTSKRQCHFSAKESCFQTCFPKSNMQGG